jgi:hypothetical protein
MEKPVNEKKECSRSRSNGFCSSSPPSPAFESLRCASSNSVSSTYGSVETPSGSSLSCKPLKFRPRYADEGLEDFDSDTESPVNFDHKYTDVCVGTIVTSSVERNG